MENLGNGRHLVHYLSERDGLVPFVVGLLQGLAKRFDCGLEILNQEEMDVPTGTHATFEVTVR